MRRQLPPPPIANDTRLRILLGDAPQTGPRGGGNRRRLARGDRCSTQLRCCLRCCTSQSYIQQQRCQVLTCLVLGRRARPSQRSYESLGNMPKRANINKDHSTSFRMPCLPLSPLVQDPVPCPGWRRPAVADARTQTVRSGVSGLLWVGYKRVLWAFSRGFGRLWGSDCNTEPV